MKVPEIRFQEFDEEWHSDIVGLLCDFIVPGRNKPQVFDGDIPWVTTPDVTSNCVSKSKIGLAISKEEAERVGAKIVPKNSIIISCVGDLGLVTKADNDLIINQQLHAFIPRENINKWFLLYELLTRKKHMENVATKTAVPYMNKENCNSIPIVFPAYNEQTQIGNTFQKLDSLINQHQQKHDKLSSIKKAMLVKMFPKQGETTPEIRFKGFSGEWEEKELNNEVELFSGLTYSPTDIRKEGTFVIRSSNVKNGQLVQADNVYVNSEAVNCSNVKEGDVIVVVRNGSRSLIGKHAQVTSCMDNTVIGAFMTGIRSQQPEFLNSLLDTNQFTAEVEKNLGATINQITNGAFRSMVFMFPKEDEQNAIGNYFQKLDTLIYQQQQQITKLNNIKQACLSKMFV